MTVGLITHEVVGLSAAPQGTPFYINVSAHPAQIVHQAHATRLDFITVWLSNIGTTDVLVTAVITPASLPSSGSSPVSCIMTIPGRSGKLLFEPGILLTNGQELKLIASQVSVISVTGYVYRRSQS